VGLKVRLRTAVAYFWFCHVHAAEEHVLPQCLQQVKHLQRSILHKYNIIVSTAVLDPAYTSQAFPGLPSPSAL
jgi:hypothetical protein